MGMVNFLGLVDLLIVYFDICCNLMDQKSFVEGVCVLVIWCVYLIDCSYLGQDQVVEVLVLLLIFVVKGFLIDKGFEIVVQVQQVFGGYGYIEEQGML